jgi:hypothetical protein
MSRVQSGIVTGVGIGGCDVGAAALVAGVGVGVGVGVLDAAVG